MKHFFFFLLGVFLIVISCTKNQTQVKNPPTKFEKMLKKARTMRFSSPEKALKLYHICDSYTGARGQNFGAKCNVKKELAWTYFLLNDYDSAMSFFREALQEQNTIKDLGEIYRGIGGVHSVKRNLDSADIYVEKAIKYYEESNFQLGLIKARTLVGTILMHRGLVDEAMPYFHEAIDYHLYEKNYRWLTTLYLRIGVLFTEMKNYKEARAYLFKAYDLAKERHVSGLFDNIYATIADSYQQESLLDSALVYYRLVLSLDSVQRPPDGLILIYPKIGDIYRMQNKFDLARGMYEKSMEICVRNGNEYGILVNRLSLASLLKEQGNFEEAISSIEQVALEVDRGDKRLWRRIYFDLYQANKLKGDSQQALSYYELYTGLNDSLVGENVRKSSLDLEKKYQTRLKNEQISSLQTLVQKNKVISYGKISILILIIGLLIFLVLWLRAKKNLIKRLHESEKQEKAVLKTELGNKTKELTSNMLRLAASQDVAQEVKRKIDELLRQNAKLAKSDFIQITNYLNNQNNSKRWKEFHKQFDELHTGFLDKLTQLYPDLTASEIRLCTLLRLNLTTKDICFITSRSLRTVENVRYRLRKKMKLDRDSALSQHILSI